jgi:hypothetical protein
MSVRIQLDNKLEHKNVSNFSKLESKSDLDLKTPDNYFAQYEQCERLLERTGNDYRTQNNFINAFLDSYNLHKTLKIRPDDIKLQMLTIISICVNNNPEKFRSYFVDHEDKKDLVVISNTFSADYFCGKFAKLLKENIKDKEFAMHYTTKFTTTNQIISTVNNITLMNTLKEYFSYTMILDCGIPAVILEGTQEDWEWLNESYLFFKKIFGETELKHWFTHFDKVMELFMMMRKSQKEKETFKETNTEGIFSKITNSIYGMFINNNENTQNDKQNDKQNDIDMTYIKEMWKRVICYIPQGSGDDQILGGWVRLFVPYNNSNKLIGGLDKDIPCMDLTKQEPVQKHYYEWQNDMKKFYLGAGWGEMFSSFITTPAILINYEQKKYKVEFYSGFFPPHLTESDEVCMNVGYMLREDQKIKKDKLKNAYMSKGVEKDGYSLKIPKYLQKNIDEILSVFDACFYNYYGVDPEEETKKQYYLDEGVKQTENKRRTYKKYLVPSKFKDDEKAIEEIKKLFRIYKVDFYEL